MSANCKPSREVHTQETRAPLANQRNAKLHLTDNNHYYSALLFFALSSVIWSFHLLRKINDVFTRRSLPRSLVCLSVYSEAEFNRENEPTHAGPFNFRLYQLKKTGSHIFRVHANRLLFTCTRTLRFLTQSFNWAVRTLDHSGIHTYTGMREACIRKIGGCLG